MRITEIIRFQSSEIQTDSKYIKLWRLIQNELEGSDCLDYQILARTDRSGEMMVVIYWNQERIDSRGSQISQILSLEIQNYGSVNYSTWTDLSED